MISPELVKTWLVKHVVSPVDRAAFRMTGGRLRLTIGRPVLLLSSIGRRTGMVRSTPMFYLRDGEDLVLQTFELLGDLGRQHVGARGHELPDLDHETAEVDRERVEAPGDPLHARRTAAHADPAETDPGKEQLEPPRDHEGPRGEAEDAAVARPCVAVVGKVVAFPTPCCHAGQPCASRA